MLGIYSLNGLEPCLKHSLLWKEKGISRIGAVQMGNLRGLLGTRRIDRVPNARIRELWEVKKVFSGFSAKWRGWGGIILLRESM